MKRDERGQTFIPVRVLISIVVAGVVAALAFGGLQYSMKLAAEKQVERECNKLLSQISTMIASGDARDISDMHDRGDKRIIELDLPAELVYLGLGVDPDDKAYGLTGNGSCIFYKIEGMSKRVIWLDENMEFRKGRNDSGKWVIDEPEQGFVINGGGKYTITFELVKDTGGTKYILIEG